MPIYVGNFRTLVIILSRNLDPGSFFYWTETNLLFEFLLQSEKGKKGNDWGKNWGCIIAITLPSIVWDRVQSRSAFSYSKVFDGLFSGLAFRTPVVHEIPRIHDIPHEIKDLAGFEERLVNVVYQNSGKGYRLLYGVGVVFEEQGQGH